jgi:hypothetical protein
MECESLSVLVQPIYNQAENKTIKNIHNLEKKRLRFFAQIPYFFNVPCRNIILASKARGIATKLLVEPASSLCLRTCPL